MSCKARSRDAALLFGKSILTCPDQQHVFSRNRVLPTCFKLPSTYQSMLSGSTVARASILFIKSQDLFPFMQVVLQHAQYSDSLLLFKMAEQGDIDSIEFRKGLYRPLCDLLVRLVQVADCRTVFLVLCCTSQQVQAVSVKMWSSSYLISCQHLVFGFSCLGVCCRVGTQQT